MRNYHSDATDLWPSYRQFVYTLKIAWESIGSDSLKAELDMDLIERIYKLLDQGQKKVFSDKLWEIGHALLDAVAAAESHSKFDQEITAPDDREVQNAVNLAMRWGAIETLAPNSLTYTLSAASVTAHSSFEILCSEILETFYALRPEAISKDRSIRLDDVLKSSNLNDLIRREARRQADRDIRESITHWLAVVAKHSGSKLPDKNKDWPDPWKFLCRQAEIRNCLVHYNGRVDERFLSRISDLGYSVEEFKVNRSLSPNRDGVKSAILAYLATGTQAFLGFSITQAPNRSARIEIEDRILLLLAELQWELIESNHLLLAESLSSCRPTLESGDEPRSIDIASWTCEHLLGKSESKSAIKHALWKNDDISKMHRHALLDDQALVAIVRSAVNHGTVSRVNLLLRSEFVLVRKMIGEELLAEISVPSGET